MKANVKITVSYNLEISLPENPTGKDVRDAIFNADIPENDQCQYINFHPEEDHNGNVKIRIGEDFYAVESDEDPLTKII